MGKPDRYSVGRSSRCQFIRGEFTKERHSRRKEIAAKDKTELEGYCTQKGLTLRIRNEGHHWIIQGTYFKAEWFPSSAKLVFNQKWDYGIHAHDITQVMFELDRIITRGK